MALKLAQTKVTKAGFRIALALALSVMLSLPAASADSTITLTSPNAQHNGQFGVSVAINEGDPIVVVGAPDETANALPRAGHAYVLDTTTGLIITLTSPNAQILGGFGLSVAVSGTTVVVGAPFETANALVGAGHAYVFDATDGSLITTLTSPIPEIAGQFGNSVSISGTTVVVGAPDETANALLAAGHAYVFDATDGSLITTLTSPNAQGDAEFGFSVAVSCTTVVVGAPFETANALLVAGHAYVFDATDGSLITTLTSPNAQNGGRFGSSVAVSGTTVVVGAPSETANALLRAGHAYVFDASTGSPIASLTSPYAQASGEFGFSVSVSCATVVVGALAETANGQPRAGHAYSFDASTGFLTTTLTSPNAQMNGLFGSSVAVSGTTVVVGAPSETGGGFTQAGHAYVFP
jgi:outer membrane protein assembly factor BamB